jgi:hypothetical protein
MDDSYGDGASAAGATPLVLGLELTAAPDLALCLEDAKETGHDFIVVPLVHPRQRRLLSRRPRNLQPLTRSDKVLSSRGTHSTHGANPPSRSRSSAGCPNAPSWRSGQRATTQYVSPV